MPARFLKSFAFFACISLVAACADPECPYGYMKIQNACLRIDGGRALETDEAGANATTVEEAGTAPAGADGGQTSSSSATTSDASTPSTASTADGGPGMQTQPTMDASSPLPDATTPPAMMPECDNARPCSAGYVCSAMKCVSACTQTQCDQNATCSLVNNVPTCTCNRGFIAMNGTGGAVTCLRDVACEELGCDANASCVVGSDQLRTCACKNGYTGNGKSCTPVSCDAPTIENGTVSTSSGNTFGSTATYRCSTGYQQAAGGSWTRMCGSNMQWSGTQPSCTAITCLPLTNPSNGAVSTAQGREYGDTATYTCNPRYALSGSGTRTCQASGWSGSEPTCASTCKNRSVDSGERCDPTVSPYNLWSCNDTCDQLTTMYTACTSNAGCGGGSCFSGVCGTACSASNPVCPATPTGSTTSAFCVALVGACAATGCSSNSDCAPGLVCKFQSAISRNLCTGCSSDTDCGGRTCQLFSTAPNIGHCR